MEVSDHISELDLLIYNKKEVMAKVQAARGLVDTRDLGVTLVHEHICFDSLGKTQTETPFPEKTFAFNLDLLKKARDVGIQTIVELTPWPNVGRIVELNEKVPELNIILSTGSYLQSCGHPVTRMGETELYDHMREDLTRGYAGFQNAGVKAGIIKVAAETSRLTEWEKRNFRLAARVQRECRVPIATHACAGASEQMEVLKAAGANLAATFYSHVEAEFGWDGRSLQEEADYLSGVARAGGYLHFNNFDFEFDTPFPDLMYLINHLENSGFGDKVLYSIDTNITVDGDGKIWMEAEREHPETGRRTYAYAITNATPMLMAAGVSLQRINRYLIDNPRRYFEAAC
jgi:phosphotriesterase-related protein